MQCHVRACRYKHTHTTLGHKCLICERYGHGAMECGNIQDIMALEDYYGDVVCSPCTCIGCTFSMYHTFESHCCVLCLGYGHGDCPPVHVKCPTCRSSVKSVTGNVRLFLHKSECPVCFESCIGIVFSCGHGLCLECFNKISPPASGVPSIMQAAYTTAALNALIIHPELLNSIPEYHAFVRRCRNVQTPVYTTHLINSHDQDILYMRRRAPGCAVEGFVLHIDMTGRYGAHNPDTDHLPFAEIFILGCIHI